MIIQIDHVAMSSINFEQDSKVINLLDYRQQFIKRGIRNLKIKRGFMRRFREEHDLGLFTSDYNIGIELIDYKHTNVGNSYILPIFENVPSDLREDFDRKMISDCMLTEARLKPTDAPIYIKEDTDRKNFRFDKMVVKVKDFKKSITFWKILGFKLLQVEKDFALLEFKSLFRGSSYYIYLQENTDGDDEPYLDDKGFNCIAFITNSPKNEKGFFDSKGIKTTKIERLILNERQLDIFLARGACGELVEIVGLGEQ